MHHSEMQEEKEIKKPKKHRIGMKEEGIYDLESFQSPLESLYERKER